MSPGLIVGGACLFRSTDDDVDLANGLYRLPGTDITGLHHEAVALLENARCMALFGQFDNTFEQMAKLEFFALDGMV